MTAKTAMAQTPNAPFAAPGTAIAQGPILALQAARTRLVYRLSRHFGLPVILPGQWYM
ncbi:hypothetical protein N6L24_09685 [Cognatishimia sp. SS12]|uniref:hypothetical protein n=1 Tax=Cognatishimia sp. SS12 TaxID=2979465 RepID=UPI00232F5256|nr:hypothetical protein [Cognatishimia sp. SS12]MDC0738551.1 hypothetical protein [Cognatishimia sp. SS12]